MTLPAATTHALRAARQAGLILNWQRPRPDCYVLVRSSDVCWLSPERVPGALAAIVASASPSDEANWAYLLDAMEDLAEAMAWWEVTP